MDAGLISLYSFCSGRFKYINEAYTEIRSYIESQDHTNTALKNPTKTFKRKANRQ